MISKKEKTPNCSKRESSHHTRRTNQLSYQGNWIGWMRSPAMSNPVLPHLYTLLSEMWIALEVCLLFAATCVHLTCFMKRIESPSLAVLKVTEALSNLYVQSRRFQRTNSTDCVSISHFIVTLHCMSSNKTATTTTTTTLFTLLNDTILNI